MSLAAIWPLNTSFLLDSMLSKLVVNHFQNCSIFMFTNEEKIENHSFLSLITDGVLISRLEVENHVTNRTSLTKSHVTFVADKMDLHQHRNKCTAAFIFTTQFSSNSAIRTYEAYGGFWFARYLP